MFYDNLKSACEKNNVKMTSIVKECGFASGSIGSWKKGVYPNSELVEKFAARLNVSCDYLILGKDNGTVLSDEEQNLLDKYRLLSDKRKGKIELLLEQYTEEQAKEKN